MDKSAKATGLLVFVAGVALMIVVFVSALDMLHGTHAAALDTKKLPQEGMAIFARVCFLFVLGYIASAVAGRGIHLFEAAHEPSPAERSTPAAAKQD
jgi:hypothetical protein